MSGEHEVCPVDGRKIYHRPKVRAWWSPEVELIVTALLAVGIFISGFCAGVFIHQNGSVASYRRMEKERDQWRTAYELLHTDVEKAVKHFDESDKKLLEEVKRLRGDKK